MEMNLNKPNGKYEMALLLQAASTGTQPSQRKVAQPTWAFRPKAKIGEANPLSLLVLHQWISAGRR
jgi:hypothetical protein